MTEYSLPFYNAKTTSSKLISLWDFKISFFSNEYLIVLFLINFKPYFIYTMYFIVIKAISQVNFYDNGRLEGQGDILAFKFELF
jgi:hypothetical protein